ncbi:nuclease-related domain-containing protein [Aerococcus agrisoli]|uniref:nuclease-related domain-containing protein n=1 Tax=Aerococcus agrisoli TaxID=2487350 RepID=UPI0013152A16|nr:nuclease-related domain-containing protein [Aerococcus agrisoli]
MQSNDKLLQLNLLVLRNGFLDKYQLDSRHYILSGLLGEALFSDFVSRYGHKSWAIYSDYWFNYGKRMQADFLLVTSERWLVVEVKHYDGRFEYKGNECYLNDKLMDDNYLLAMDLRVKKIRHMAQELNQDIVVEGLFVFIHENSEAKVHLDYALDFDVKLRNELKGFLSQLKRTDNRQLSDGHLRKVDAVLDKYRVKNPFLPKPIKQEDWAGLTKGINCCTCDSFDLAYRHKTVICNDCGAIERKDAAILRMAEQVRILFYGEDYAVTGARVYELCDKRISINAIHKVLRDSRK